MSIITYDNKTNKLVTWFIFFILIALPLSGLAASSSSSANDTLTKTFCSVITLLTGDIARLLAIIISFFIGTMLLLGKLQWGVAIAVLFGIAIVFGAKEVANLIGGTGASVCQ
jgi:type IV secretion system protein VirB2